MACTVLASYKDVSMAAISNIFAVAATEMSFYGGRAKNGMSCVAWDGIGWVTSGGRAVGNWGCDSLLALISYVSNDLSTCWL